MEKNDKLDTDKFLNLLKLIDGEPLTNNYKYAVFFVWEKFIPKLSNNLLDEMSKKYNSGNNKIYIGCVNLDFYDGTKIKMR